MSLPFRFPPLRPWLPALFLLLLGACQHAPRLAADTVPPACDPASQARLQPLLQLVEQRLAVAPLVAQSKWNSGAPIDDPARESQILDGVMRQAQAAGLEPAPAAAFFQAQFDAGKLWQRQLHRQWRAAQRPPFAAAPDLGRDVRPVLDRLTPQLIAALRELPLSPPQLAACARQAAAPAGLDAEVWALALRPLRQP